MRGYVLVRAGNGELVRIEAERSARAALIRLLEETAPEGSEVLGMVVDVGDLAHLRIVGA